MTVRWRIPRIDRWSLALGTRPWSSDVSRPAVNAPLAQLPAGSMDKRKTRHHARSTGLLVPGWLVKGWLTLALSACVYIVHQALQLGPIAPQQKGEKASPNSTITQNNNVFVAVGFPPPIPTCIIRILRCCLAWDKKSVCVLFVRMRWALVLCGFYCRCQRFMSRRECLL